MGQARDWFGHPAAIHIVSALAAMERFAYAGLMAVLVLFLSAPLERYGLNWSEPDAVVLVGVVTAMLYGLMFLGGLAADHVLGLRRALILGACLLAAGHAAIGLPALLPDLLGTLYGGPVRELVVAAHLPLGQFAEAAGAAARLRSLAPDPATLAAARLVYPLSAISLYGSILCFSAGGWLFVTSATTAIGRCYAHDDIRRDAGFAIYFLYLSIGFAAATLISGTLGIAYGFPFGFLTNGIAIAIGLALFLLGPRIDLTGSGSAQDEQHSAQPETIGASAIMAFATLAALALVFWLSYDQVFGYLSLLIENRVDRRIGAFAIPTPWFLAINPIVWIVFSPLLAMLWTHLGKSGRGVNYVSRFAIGLALMALCFATIGSAALFAPTASAGIAAAPVMLALVIHGLAEMILGPAGYALISRAIPVRHVALVTGMWFGINAMSGLLSGYFGLICVHHGPVALCLVVGIGCLVASALLFALLKPLSRSIGAGVQP